MIPQCYGIPCRILINSSAPGGGNRRKKVDKLADAALVLGVANKSLTTKLCDTSNRPLIHPSHPPFHQLTRPPARPPTHLLHGERLIKLVIIPLNNNKNRSATILVSFIASK